MIEIDALTKTYGAVTAVDNLSLRVPRGELFCFLGPNGAGKTTTIKVLTGLLKPTCGRVLLDGIDVHRDPVAAKRILGYIPDMPYVYERLTATEFFRFTGDLYAVPRGRVDAELETLFRLFGLLDCRAALVKDLSHGMRQRLIYAATFLHDPGILCIDEPLMGLDPHTIRLIKDLLVARARDGKAVFLSTHILPVAEDIADRIGIIDRGRLVTVGTLGQLRERYGGRTLEDVFIACTGRPVAP
jgi:ABC-2 type transport system ATP-binding protein